MKVPITQSQDWAKLQDDLGETSFYRQGNGYVYLAIKKHTPVGNYLYVPYGPVAKDQGSFDQALKSLAKLAEQHQAIFTRIEPQDRELRLPQSAKKARDLNPAETWVLDLRGSDEDLKSRLPSRLLRYHRNMAKNGLYLETSHDPADIHYLLDLQKALAAEKGINTFSEHYLGTELKQPFATLYLLKQHSAAARSDQNSTSTSTDASDPVLAAGLVFDHDHIRYNLQGAQAPAARNLHATGILTIQLILDAKAKGLQTFDFWGIAPEGASQDHPWAGFTAFKKTFQGTERRYHGTYDLVHRPLRYQLFTTLHRLKYGK